MGPIKYIALGVFLTFAAIFVATMPLSYFFLAVFVGDLLGVPCGGVC